MWYLIMIIVTFIILLSTILLFSDIIDNNNMDFLWNMLITCSVLWIISLPIILIVSIGKFIQWNLKDKDIK